MKHWWMVLIGMMVGIAVANPPSETFAFETEAELSLSLFQECEEVVSRAERWLSQHPRVKDENANEALPLATLAIDAIARGGQPVIVEATWLEALATVSKTLCATDSPLQERFVSFERALAEGGFPTVEAHPIEVAFYSLYLLQQQHSGKLPEDWRTQIALQLVNTQRYDAKGGYWKAPQNHTLSPIALEQPQPLDATVWAVYVLREIMHENPSLKIIQSQEQPLRDDTPTP
ncbi:MAG: hypothetical protein Q4C03_00990 [bacterium]|nr:hypothetical protein [bacterium]